MATRKPARTSVRKAVSKDKPRARTKKLGGIRDALVDAAPSTMVTLQAEAVGGAEAIRFWLMPETSTGRPRAFPIHAKTLKGKASVNVGVKSLLYLQFLGNPGDAVKFKVTGASKKALLEAEAKLGKVSIDGFVWSFTA